MVVSSVMPERLLQCQGQKLLSGMVDVVTACGAPLDVVVVLSGGVGFCSGDVQTQADGFLGHWRDVTVNRPFICRDEHDHRVARTISDEYLPILLHAHSFRRRLV